MYTFDLLDLQETSKGSAHLNGVVFGDRRKYIEERYNALRRFEQKDVEILDPTKVEDLTDRQIAWLITPAQIENVPAENLLSLIKHIDNLF